MRLKSLLPYQKQFLSLNYLVWHCLAAHSLEVQLCDLSTYCSMGNVAVLWWETEEKEGFISDIMKN